MSNLDTNHVISLDLIKDRANAVIKFGLADVETSDFYLGLYNNGTRIFDENYIVTLYIVKPNGTFRNIKLEPKEGLKKYYCNLPDTLKNIPGEYLCQAIIFDNLANEKKVSKSKFKYSVDLDLASEMAGIIDEEEQESILTNILNRLLTLENPVEPYATQKHVDECVSTLTEEIDSIKIKDVDQDGRLDAVESKNVNQDNRLDIIEAKDIEQDNRLVNIETRNTEQDNRLNIIESKDIEQDGRLNTLENKVDGIDEKIVGTIEPTLANHGNRVDTLENKDLVHESRMTDIESKNVEQDNRLTSVEGINTTQDNRLDALEVKDIAHESRMVNIETKNTEQDNRLNSLESKDLIHELRMTDIESKNIEQDERLSNIESKNTEQDGRLDITENRLANIGNDITNTMQPIIDEHTSRLEAIEAIDVSQNNRLDAIEAKNQQQDDRLLDIEKVNSRQDIDIKCLYGASQTIDITKEGNSIYLQNSNNGFAIIDEIQGNTMVNCNKEPNKEIILNGNINTQGYSNVTFTEGVDGGKVDVALEGNTMVNVCDQKDPVAITKSYTVETGNHVALQGEYDGKCRPVVTGNTLVNLYDNNIVIKERTLSTWYATFKLTDTNLLKDGQTYTLLYNLTSKDDTSDGKYSYMTVGIGNDGGIIIPFKDSNDSYDPSININGLNKIVFNYSNKDSYEYLYFRPITRKTTPVDGESITYTFYNIILLEGDYTDKPIPEYFEGLQSSFEDKVVTQEMVDAGEELAENLGKYKVDYVVTGKNKFDIDKAIIQEGKYHNCDMVNNSWSIANNSNFKIIGLIPIKPNTSYTITNTGTASSVFYDKNKKVIKSKVAEDYSFISPSDAYYIMVNAIIDFDVATFQLEEGTEVTPYEPYKEYKKTFYLNSPLLEGDTIEQQGDNVVHVRRNELRAYQTDDELTLPTDMIDTLIAKPSPQYEVISQNDTILCDSYINGHLDVDSVVPIEKVDFLHFEEELTYLYVNTQYTVQFVSDAVSKVDITLGGAKLLNQDVVVGTNKYTITTPSELIDNNLVLNGEGFNASNIVVTEATDQDFGYFEGMKSVGECEDLEVVSSNSDSTSSTTQTLTHEPLRAVGGIKDKYVLIDGKWYIDRNCGVRAYQEGDIDNYITDMINTVYPLSTPTYEPIDYNPFTVYSDTTHISNNSTIPANMVIKNTGYNCLLKPSTTYTVSSNLGLNTVTTPSTLTEDCLRFYDTDTSNVTTMKNVMVLEGDYTTGKPLPAHFSGIESAFEQEYDEAVGKYKVKIRVQNEDASKENYIEFYIDEALRGVGDVKDKVYVKNDKVVVERNCGSVTFDGSTIINKWAGAVVSKNLYWYDFNVNNMYCPSNKIDVLCNTLICDSQNSHSRTYTGTVGGITGGIRIVSKYDTLDFKQWLQQNPTTVVYSLAEPTYEEVEYNDVKLFIESFKNSTLFYSSNIPVTSKVWYSYSIPIVDTVAQTASISDQQDSMIIDLATQVSVMEMMLM